MDSGGRSALGRERLLLKARRWWVSTAADPLLRWVLLVALLLGPLVAVLFAWAAVVDGGWAALQLLICQGDPQHSASPPVAVALVFVGWLLVPAAIGALVGVTVDRGVTRSRDRLPQDVDKQTLDELLDDTVGEDPA